MRPRNVNAAFDRDDEDANVVPFFRRACSDLSRVKRDQAISGGKPRLATARTRLRCAGSSPGARRGSPPLVARVLGESWAPTAGAPTLALNLELHPVAHGDPNVGLRNRRSQVRILSGARLTSLILPANRAYRPATPVPRRPRNRASRRPTPGETIAQLSRGMAILKPDLPCSRRRTIAQKVLAPRRTGASVAVSLALAVSQRPTVRRDFRSSRKGGAVPQGRRAAPVVRSSTELMPWKYAPDAAP
jgi:hypothetical protein